MTPLYHGLSHEPHPEPDATFVSVNLHWRILGLTLGAVHPMGLDKCIRMCIHHYSIIQSILIALKTLYVSPLHPTTPQSLKTTDLYSLYNFAFSRTSQSWSYTSWRLFRLASFTLSSAFKVPPCLSMVWFYHWIKWSLPLSGGTTVYLAIHILTDTLIASKFWQVWTELIKTSVCRFLCGPKFSAPLGKCQGVWLPDRVARVCLISKKAPEWPYHFAFPPTMTEMFLMLYVLTSLWGSQCPDPVIFLGMWGISLLLKCAFPWWHLMGGASSWNVPVCHQSTFSPTQWRCRAGQSLGYEHWTCSLVPHSWN